MNQKLICQEEKIRLPLDDDVSASGSVCLFTKIDRFVHVLRYYRWTKLVNRFKHHLLNKLGSRMNPYRVAKPEIACSHLDDLTLQRLQEFEKLAKFDIPKEPAPDGFVKIGGQLVRLKLPFDWKDVLGQLATRLLNFQAHYHEFLLDPVLIDRTAVKEEAITDCITGWIQLFPSNSSSPDAWHPYCISRRLPVWLFLTNFIDRTNTEFFEALTESILWQTESLANNLEFDPGGNHLMENLTCLAIVSATIESPHSDRWAALVERHLSKEIGQQILPHGEHFECSPMYHTHVLYTLLRTAYLTRERFPLLSQTCQMGAERMLGFINQILHPDGDIPLLSDSIFEETISANKLRKLSDLVSIKPYPSKRIPYAILKSSQSWLLFDAGQHGCSWLPAHAHNDLLSFEISWQRKRWIVDSGNFEYQPGKLRDYCRSAIAHNVVTVDNRNHSDVWGSFMMGHRGFVRLIELPYFKGVQWAAGAHNGYRRYGLSWLHRALGLLENDTWFCLDWGKTNKRDINLYGFLHFAPEVNLTRLDHHNWLSDNGNDQRSFAFFETEETGIFEYPYCCGFNKQRPAEGIWYRLKKGKEFLGGWVSTSDSQCEPIVLQRSHFSLVAPHSNKPIVTLNVAAHSI